MSPRSLNHLRLALRLVMVAVYLAAGALHLRSPDAFAVIMPPFIPHPRAMVLFTGACEVAGAIGLLIPRLRWLAGVMLALYALCVWPANIYQAFWHVPAPPLPDSWWYHAPRLAFQPVLVWWALFAGDVTDWPFTRRRPSF